MLKPCINPGRRGSGVKADLFETDEQGMVNWAGRAGFNRNVVRSSLLYSSTTLKIKGE